MRDYLREKIMNTRKFLDAFMSLYLLIRNNAGLCREKIMNARKFLYLCAIICEKKS